VVADFSSQGTDFSGLYTDPSAPKDADPADQLFRQLSTANQPAPSSPTPAQTAQQTTSTEGIRPPTGGNYPQAPDPNATATPATPSPTPQPSTNPNSTQNPAADQAALLARLAPLGIKSISELKSKSDVELRKLSTDAVQYEQRQRDLAKHFWKNPDGSWDFSKGPDGRPTGLDATGKVLPPPGTTPAPTPTNPNTPVAKPNRPKPGGSGDDKKPPKRRRRNRVTLAPARKSGGGGSKSSGNDARRRRRRKPSTRVTQAPRTTDGRGL
jgi:hypothetical protein